MYRPAFLTVSVLSLFAIGPGDGPAEPAQPGQTDPPLKPFLGDWALTLPTKEAGWLSVREVDGEPQAQIMWAVGGVRPVGALRLEDGALSFIIRKRRPKKDGPVVRTDSAILRVEGKRLDGVFRSEPREGDATEEAFSGRRLPPMPPRPDLSKARFAEPIELFNGRDLTGWRLTDPKKKQGWSVRDGVLVNETPKTDFSAYGDYGNLRTEREFEDFRLHIEFRVQANGNSGVYLRGMYEAQVVDRDSRMQGIQGVGGIFGRIPPSKNAGKPGGEWQTYDITLVDRHVTVILNGELVIDNQPVEGPTGGALQSDPELPGPLYLQGDHTSVEYRNIRLAPRIH